MPTHPGSPNAMVAILHCVVTEVENARLREQVQAWRKKTETDPLMQEIRRLRELRKELDDRIAEEIRKNTQSDRRIEIVGRYGWNMAFAGFNLQNPDMVDDMGEEDLLANWSRASEEWAENADIPE